MLLFVVLVSLSTFIFSSFHSSSFPIISFPTSKSTGEAGRGGTRPMRMATAIRDGAGGEQAWPTGMSSCLFYPFFSSCHF